MADYLILTPPGADPFDSRARFVRDAFSLAAFLLPLPWLLWHRLWWHAAALFVFDLGLFVLDRDATAPVAVTLVGLAVHFWVGLEGRAMLARYRERQGWTLRAVLRAETLDHAEQLYYEDRIMPHIARHSGSSPSGTAPVLGLFQPYGGR